MPPHHLHDPVPGLVHNRPLARARDGRTGRMPARSEWPAYFAASSPALSCIDLEGGVVVEHALDAWTSLKKFRKIGSISANAPMESHVL